VVHRAGVLEARLARHRVKLPDSAPRCEEKQER
jgi:hypothetical protein